MKTGLTTSVILHTAALAFGLLTLSAPAALPSADVESVAVEIVPMEAVSQVQQGDKKAVMHEKPAPTPTQRPDIVPDAQKIGENTVDTDKPITPEAKPRPIDPTFAPEKAPTPVEKPKTEDVPKPQEKPKPVPATEVAPVPQPKEEVKPEPVKQTDPKPTPAKEPTPAPQQDKTSAIKPQPEVKPDAVADTITQDQPAEATQLPDSAPAPEARPKPQPAPAESAKTPDRKDADKPVKEASAKPKSDEKQFNADDISKLLDMQKPSGGGAKSSTQQSSLGGDKNQGTKLSQSELDGLKAQITRCWNVTPGTFDGDSQKVTIRMKLTQDGQIDGAPEVVSGGDGSPASRIVSEGARRAVLRCAPYNLPVAKYDGALGWNEVEVNFIPSDLY